MAELWDIYDINRNKTGRVSPNHDVYLQPAKNMSEGAILSVRGIGHAKLLEIGSMSKKVRLFIKVGLYER